MKSALTVLAVLALASPALAAEASASGAVDPLVFRIAVFVLAAFIGYYVVWAVTPALHTPLMSVTNAISGVVVVGAIIAATASAVQVTDPETSQRIWIAKGLGAASIGFAAVNIFGGFLVTNRMLAMYKKKDRPANS